jgi:hypothetical protein
VYPRFIPEEEEEEEEEEEQVTAATIITTTTLTDTGRSTIEGRRIIFGPAIVVFFAGGLLSLLANVMLSSQERTPSLGPISLAEQYVVSLNAPELL